ncbi:Uma2 family endonuclease [Nocardia sp. NPDC052112]|uniref:Uma2 family endonuclease n=1 Tax=Nocardia sp. NPDC052112 TaxID=3155646 RepID=UPI003438CC79
MPIPGLRDWTAADLDHLPENGLRYEVLNGQLIVTAAPTPRHQTLIACLVRALEVALPPGHVVLAGVGVLVGDDEPVPDLIVVSGPIQWDDSAVLVEQVKLVVEVVSESTALQDRMVKPVLYAAAGIPNYWRVEINPFGDQLVNEALPVVFTHVLGADETYAQKHRVATGDIVTVRDPFEFTVDPASLMP